MEVRKIAVPDYTILLACNHTITILCIGGAISIDSTYRIYNLNLGSWL